MFAVYLSYMAFIYYVEVGSSVTIFWRVFIRNGCWILLNTFSASIEIIIFLFFNLLICCITLIDLYMLKNPCIPGINITWSWCMILLICCWVLWARIFCDVFVWFLYQGDAGLGEWVWKCSFVRFFMSFFFNGTFIFST